MSAKHDTFHEKHSSILEPVVTAEEKALRASLLRDALPSCQPQEGSPPNTFTESEIQELQAALPHMNIRPRTSTTVDNNTTPSPVAAAAADAVPRNGRIDICSPWVDQKQQHRQKPKYEEASGSDSFCPQEAPQEAPQAGRDSVTQNESAPQENISTLSSSLDWHGAPRFPSNAISLPRAFRQEVRAGRFTRPTNGQCPGFMQCNLVVLPAGKHAFDFLLFCQRNPQACPLVEVCDEGSPFPVGLAQDADLRTDCPKYAIYRNGELEREVTDVTSYWPENSVAFLIGCSFSYDGALLDAGIPLRSAEQGRNVPMYRTNLKCRSAGSLGGHMVVSMKPIPALQVAKEVEITSDFPHAHGGPVCIGRPDVIGVNRIDQPDWGDPVDMLPDEVPVFHACGVTPQSILTESKVPFAITHAAGHMFVTDLPSDYLG